MLEDGEPRVELELVAANDLGGSPRQVQFSISFEGTRETPLSQGCYSLQHDALGVFDLFLVPIGREDDRVIYEAVFNRLIPRERPKP